MRNTGPSGSRFHSTNGERRVHGINHRPSSLRNGMAGRDPESPVVDLAVTDNFLAEAPQLRAAVCDRFSSEGLDSPARFAWDWCHVADQFTYLRTSARAFFPESLHRGGPRRVDGEYRGGADSFTESNDAKIVPAYLEPFRAT